MRFETLEDRTMPTTLGLGDLAFTGYQATAPDKISFVLLKDIVSGTVVTITDNAWSGTALASGEGNSVITFGSSFSAGTQFNYQALRSAGSKWAVESVTTNLSDITGNNFSLNQTGDNLFAYNGSTPPSTGGDSAWIAAFASNVFLTTGTPANNQTYLPSAFSLGDTAFTLGLAVMAANENGAQTSPSSASGTPAQIRASVNTPSHWTTFSTAGGQAIPPAINFTVSSSGGNNVAPTGLSLSNTSIVEGNAVNATVGVFTTTDANAVNTFTYSLVSGNGSTNNSSFNISGSTLRAAVSFDAATQNTYSIRVRTTDQGGLSFEQTFTIAVAQLPSVLLNEIEANPPGNLSANNKFQYIELRGTPGLLLDNVSVVMIEGNSGTVGIATYVINLTGGSLGSNGLLMIKSPTAGHTSAPGTTVVADVQFDNPSGALNKHTVSFFLTHSTVAFTQGADYDSNNDGSLDNLPAGFVALDYVGWHDDNNPGTVYGGVVLTQGQGVPDAVTRFNSDNTTSASAWFNGDLHDVNNVPSQLLYDTTRHSANFPPPPATPSITPGAVNFNTTVVAITTTTLPGGVVAAGYNQTIAASGGISPYTFAVTNGSLPAGLSLSSGGAIAGTPTVAGSYSFAVTATDSAFATATQSYTVAIAAAATTTTLVATPLATTGGHLVLLTATVSPSPGAAGTVTFREGGVDIPNATNLPISNGMAVFSSSAFTIGSHPITAVYNGSANYLASPISNGQTVVISGAVPPPTLTGIAVNGGVANASFAGIQRSEVVGVQFSFDQAVALDPNAFALAVHSANITGLIPTLSASSPDGGFSWIVSFSGPNTDPAFGKFSLVDGVYDFTVNSSLVRLVSDSTVTGSGSTTQTLYRLFGDVAGEEPIYENTHTATVNSSDSLPFRDAFNTVATAPNTQYRSYFDFDGDGQVNTTDNLQFRNRFNRPLNWT